jgi:serine/threonine-protein kinase RsbW
MAETEHGKVFKKHVLLDSTLESVDKAEEIAIQAATEMGFEEDDAHSVGMAVRECMVNAVVHGNRYSAKKRVHLDVDATATQLTVTIGDEGEGFDLNSLPDPLASENLLRQSGRGILLIRAFMDDFDLHPRAGGGTEVRVVKNLSRP